MTANAAPAARSWTIADIASPIPFALVAVPAFLIGIVWFPAWFVAAQVMRQWAGRGGMRWFRSIGVEEYTDEKYATWLSLGPIALIAVRIFLSLNWLEPFTALANRKFENPTGEDPIFIGVALGVGFAAALTGVMRTHGLPWLLALAGFVLVAFICIGSQTGIWRANPLTAIAVAPLGWVVSVIPLSINRWFDGRAQRQARAAEDAEPSAR